MISYPYASGVFSSLGNKILSPNKIMRLAGLTEEEFIKTLHDAGFNSNIFDLKKLLIDEELKLKKVIYDNSPNEKFSNLLFISQDAEHLKVFYKCKLFKVSCPSISNNGSFDFNEIENVYNKKESNNKYLKQLVNDINLLINDNISSKELSYIIDSVVINTALKLAKGHVDALECYFKSFIDYVNILTFWRFKNLKWDFDYYVKSFITGGNLTLNIFEKVYYDDLEVIKNHFKSNDLLNKLLKDFYVNLDLNKLELKINQSLIDLAHNYCFDTFGFGPILYYYLIKEAELKNIRKVYSSSHIELEELLKY